VTTRRIGNRPRKTAEPTTPAGRYKAIVQRQWAFVRNVARRCGVPERYRDDIAIEVFLRFQKHVEDITAPSVVRAWLRTTTVHIAHEHFGAPASRYETPTAAERIRLEGQTAGAEEGFLKLETFLSLLEHVEALEPGRRAVFLAYAVDGLPISQIARNLGIPQATAYNRLRLARRQLQAALRRERLTEQRRRLTGRSARSLMLVPILLVSQPEAMRRLYEVLRELLSKLAHALPKGLLLGAPLG
jgi:RNA polymerase sigma-70 factor, ECF subfamily